MARRRSQGGGSVLPWVLGLGVAGVAAWKGWQELGELKAAKGAGVPAPAAPPTLAAQTVAGVTPLPAPVLVPTVAAGVVVDKGPGPSLQPVVQPVAAAPLAQTLSVAPALPMRAPEGYNPSLAGYNPPTTFTGAEPPNAQEIRSARQAFFALQSEYYSALNHKNLGLPYFNEETTEAAVARLWPLLEAAGAKYSTLSQSARAAGYRGDF